MHFSSTSMQWNVHSKQRISCSQRTFLHEQCARDILFAPNFANALRSVLANWTVIVAFASSAIFIGRIIRDNMFLKPPERVKLSTLLLILVICIGHSAETIRDEQQNESSPKPIEVFIRRPKNNGHYEVGSSFTLQCRFRRNNLVQPDMKFDLRWLRSTMVSDQIQNQTITETEISSSSIIIAATTRIWSVKRDDGLDLELNNFQSNDSGTYYCQAITTEPKSIVVLAESYVHISATKISRSAANELGDNRSPEFAGPRDNSSFDSYHLYSQENLSKLLPSLKIVPSSFNQITIGEPLQLVCITNDLDPDPEPDKVEWTFEQISDRLDLLERPSVPARQLPYNVTVLGNVLMIRSMLEEHAGIYKCTYRMEDFNLTVQASSEVHAINGDQVYSAPLVFVKPELVRLSINGSASIQCETTGYPPPEIIWYRVNDFAKSELIINDTEMLSSRNLDQTKILESHIEGLVVEWTDYKDLATYCLLNRCLAQRQDNPSRLKLTGLSVIHLHDAKAIHQGQYVCQASNKHGSNQASCIVDVEIKESPSVSISARDREQTIVLSGESRLQNGNRQQNVTFKCSLAAGRPKPRLRWLRTGSGVAKTNLEVDNLDLYDLTKVSSASSNVKTIAEDNGSTLTLVISAISLDDEGEYVCLGENEAGRHSAVARLIVQEPASIRILQMSPHTAKLNDSFHLDCLVSGHPIPMDIEWSRTDRGSFFSLISRSMHGSGQERATLKFDRVTQEELGEYTCNARDPLDPVKILRDTIMVVVADTDGAIGNQLNANKQNENISLIPKLMVRPTKINAPVGSSVTLDCLAVSGLQPTLVEWLAPTNQQQQHNHHHHHQATIRPYYRGGDTESHDQLLQFGSKLRILNVSKAHEGIYQCRGKNRIGVEIAPALIKVVDPKKDEWDTLGQLGDRQSHSTKPPYSASSQVTENDDQTTRTKVAKHGSNIELKCQVNGLEQLATSWSRDGLELPKSSVQLGHNLWIQNVSNKDSGLYVCSARSREPNRVIQAKINLLVKGDSIKRTKNLEAKIVASKSQVNKGDSITLECIISSNSRGNESSASSSGIVSVEDLDEVERNVVWTNLHSGQSLFQDNVYILGNLLIIYELKYENSATYRCNYNDLMQYTDYKLQVLPDASLPASADDQSLSSTGILNHSTFNNDHYRISQIIVSRGQKAELKQVPFGSRLILECNHLGESGDYYWSYGSKRLSYENTPLVVESIRSRDAGIYTCNRHSKQMLYHYLVRVLLPAARFTQSPVSFITLPTISGANQQLEIELKFLPEHGNGLLLFNGQQQHLTALNQSQGFQSADGDYLVLGLVEGGYLEFKFELGDGATTLRSIRPLGLNQWHRVMVERNRQGAIMWVDDQPAVSNSSTGKFFNLNLDSVLFVGGHQQFLYRSSAGPLAQQLYGYSEGFQGCISLLRISRQEVNLMARNRSVAVGIFECHKSECSDHLCSQHPKQEQAASAGLGSSNNLAKHSDGVCQVDRGTFEQRWDPTNGQMSVNADLRCICMPGLSGDKCSELSSYFNSTTNSIIANQSLAANMRVDASPPTKKPQLSGRACELLNPCSIVGTVRCNSLTSQSFDCLCRIGFSGADCSKEVIYEDKHSVQLNQNAYLQLAFNKAPIVEAYLRNQTSSGGPNGGLSLGDSEFNSTNYVKRISMGDSQNISFKLQTNSSYGILFYTGQLGSTSNGGQTRLSRPASSMHTHQTSKSMIVNLMSRLSQGTVSDYLAVALIDGHVEVSFELGSGVCILRSLIRVNDDESHLIQISRVGKLAKLTIDQMNKYEASSPGKLSMLNSEQDDFYIGSLPLLSTTINAQPSLIHGTHFANFVGCISQFEINSLGPLNLIHSDHLTEVRSGQNLTPCTGGRQKSNVLQVSATSKPQKTYTSPPTEGDDKEPDELRKRRRRSKRTDCNSDFSQH